MAANKVFLRNCVSLACASCLTTSLVAAPPQTTQPVYIWALTAQHALVQFDAAAPGRWLQRHSLTGLADNEKLVGIDFRIASGMLYGVSNLGRVYTIDTATARATPVGMPQGVPMGHGPHGVDFNPAADRIRLVNAQGLNARFHPDTGALVDGDARQEGVQPDPSLTLAPDSTQSGPSTEVVATAYTYNPRNDKITTNYVIERTQGLLLMQGSHEDAQPFVSPNLGRLTTVGPLGTGPLLDASFDISDRRNRAFAVVRTEQAPHPVLLEIDLNNGHGHPLGQVGNGEELVGIAIEP